MMRTKTGELIVYGPDGRRFDNEATHIENPGAPKPKTPSTASTSTTTPTDANGKAEAQT